jgi:archaellum component FlaG (FlaF/FlaG flagellin family)
MRLRYAIILLLILIAQASAEQTWDLSILRVNLYPPDAEVQQGQPLMITIYVGNNEGSQFSGAVSVSLYVDGFLKSREDWYIGNLSIGSIPIPPGGYRTIVTNLETSTLTIGVHELRVEISPKGYTDPNKDDNSYSINFVIVPLVNPFIEADSEVLQGKEFDVKVQIPNPRSEPLEGIKVRLFVNGSEIGTKESYVPPRMISAVKFSYKPLNVGTILLDALITRDDQPMGRASLSVTVKPSCDLLIERVQLSERIFAGEPISGKLMLKNMGLSASRVNVTFFIDGEAVESKSIDFIDPGEGTELEFNLDVALGMGSHTMTFKLIPLDADDLNPSDNEYSFSFRIIPVPISLSARSSGSDIYVNLTNLADLLTNVEVSLLRNGSEVTRFNATLEAGSSKLIPIRGLDPGNYTIAVYSHGSIVSSTEVSVEGGMKPESPFWLLAVVPIAAALVYYMLIRRKRRAWPSS